MLLAVSYAFGKAEELAEAREDADSLKDLGLTMGFLADRIATLHHLMDSDAPTVHNLAIKYPRDSEGRRGPAR